jgi:hypothetical protein
VFLLNFIPDSFLIWVVNTILLAGLLGTFSSYFIRFIPPLIPYAGLVKTVGIILLVAGVYLRGGYGVEMEWRNRVAEMEAKVAIAEAKSKEANVKIETVVKEKIKVVKEVQVVIQERIKEVEKRIDAQCVVDPEVITILNDAARKPK